MTVRNGSHVIIHVECCEVRELKSLVVGIIHVECCEVRELKSLVVGTQECNGYMCKSGL